MVKANPALSGTEVRRIASRGSPNSKIKPSHIRSVRAAVKSSKRATLAALTGGIPVTDAYSSIAALGDRLWFGDIIRNHNSGAHHFANVHEVLCIGNVAPAAAGEEIFLNLSTIWSILHIARGHVSGWPNCASGDGTGKISAKQVTMISFGINSVPAKYNTLNYCVGAVEKEELLKKAWEGIEATYFALMDNWKCCDMAYSTCGTCALISEFRKHPLVAVHIGRDGDRVLIEKVKSDNTDLFRNFAASIRATPLCCDTHGAGKSESIHVIPCNL